MRPPGTPRGAPRRPARTVRFGALAGCVLLALWPAAGARAASNADLRLAFWRWTGDFGSIEDNTLQNLTAEIAFNGSGSRFTLSIPWSGIDNAGNVLLTPEGPAVVGVGGQGRLPFQSDPAGSPASGIGDILVRQDFYMIKSGRGNRPSVTMFLDYKFGTADEGEGLGTGEDDWGGGLSYVQPLGKSFQILADAGYRVSGDPTGVDFNDRLRFGLGFGLVRQGAVWRLYAENVEPILDDVTVYNSTGIPTGLIEAEDYRTVRLDLAYRTSKGGTVRMGVSAGLTDAAEDLGFVLVLASGSPW
jgi:hypothetical protein